MPAAARTHDRPLESAFRAARYRVEAAHRTLELRIGIRDPFIDRLADGSRWCILTAFNPQANQVSPRSNRRAHRRLERLLLDRSPRQLLPALNRDPDGRWPDEPAWFFTFEHDREVDELAEAFDQKAVVVGEPGHPPQLRFYSPADDTNYGPTSE